MLHTQLLYFSDARAAEAPHYIALPNPDHTDHDPKKVHRDPKIETAIRGPGQGLVQKIDIVLHDQDRVHIFANTSVNQKGIPALVRNRPRVTKVKTQRVRLPAENTNVKIPIQMIFVAKNLLHQTV